MAQATKQTAATRLTEIWRAWGMKQNDQDARAQRQALALLEKFLNGGPPAVVRAMQALLVDPDRPGASKRPLFKPLWSAVEEHWPTAGTGDGTDGDRDVMLLQAMLLAVWPENMTGRALTPALLSPWMVMRGRDRQREALQRWREGCADEQLTVEDKAPVREPLDLSEARKGVKGLQKPRKLALAPNEHMSSSPYHHNVLLLHAKAADKFSELVSGLASEVGAVLDMTLAGLAELQSQPIFPAQSSQAELQELLWWGQARYCHTLRMPFRRIAEPQRALWLAASEAAERAAGLPVEPSGSYLQEMLHGLGLPLHEKRALWDYVAEMRTLIESQPPSVPQSLVTLMKEDGFGAPISLLCAFPKIGDSELREQLGVTAETSLDLGEWSAWVFRELVFLRRWQEQQR